MNKNSSQYYDYLNVPVALLKYALECKKTNQVKLFLCLKSSSSGYVQHNKPDFDIAAQHLNICNKTLKTYLKWLIQQGWVIPDQIANNYRSRAI